jgi:phenylalanyl-tRNA synthetase beta chain
VFVNGKALGFVGEIGTRARRAFDLAAELPVLLAELDLDFEPQDSGSKIEFEPLPRFPGVVRDLAIVVPQSCRNEDVESALREGGGELLAAIRLFDVYEGDQLAAGERSLAYTLTFRSPNRSLTNEEVDETIARLLRHVGKSLGARIR